MFINLNQWFHVSLPFPVWVFTLAAIVFWWLITWGIAKLLLYFRVRAGRVIYSAQMVTFLVGAIFVFNITLVPIVLIAFHGMAFYTLCICGIAALLYFLADNNTTTTMTKSSSVLTDYSYPDNDPF